jgi:DNA replication protein DnaC
MEAIATDTQKLLENIQNNCLSDEEIAKAEREKRNRENANARAKAKVLFEGAKVPSRHRKFRPELQNQNQQWRENFHSITEGLGTGMIRVILGNRGTGKTQMAVSAIWEACVRQTPCRYAKAMDVFLDIREGMRGEGEKAALKSYLKPGLLVIDALEVKGDTPFEDRLLNHLIDRRYDSMTDTILISNHSREKLNEVLGPSIVSRIHETGALVECVWPSFRSAA